MKLFAVVLLVFGAASSAGAAPTPVNPAQCSAPSICRQFYVPSLLFPDGSVQTTAGGSGGGTPSGPAGGDLSGTYPNPTVGSLGAISGASLTNLTGANVVGNISGRSGSVASGGVDFSTITTALSGKQGTTAPFYDSTFTVLNGADNSKAIGFNLDNQVTASSITISPRFTGTKTLIFAPTITASSGVFVMADGATGIVLIGTNVAIGGSNSGIQYSSQFSNRAQIRVNAYGNHAGVSGMTCNKSRGDLGTNSSLSAGDTMCRITVQGAAGTTGSDPINADMSFNAAAINSLTVPTDFNLRLMSLAGVLASKFYVTSEGAGSFVQGITASSGTLSGNISVGGGGTPWYYCTGSTAGTFDGNLARGNSNATACAGGTWVATPISSN